MPDSEPTSDWQRRYDESMARRRATPRHRDDVAPTGGLTLEALGCMGGWPGIALASVAAILGLLRALARRHNKER